MLSEDDIAELRRLYKQGLTVRQIMVKTGRSETTVRRWVAPSPSQRKKMERAVKRLPKIDSTEKIHKCLHCKKPECDNCLGSGWE